MNGVALPAIGPLLQRVEHALADEIETDTIMIGIHTGGVWLAERLHRRLALATALGTLDISLYRDDFSRVGLNPEVKGSHLAESIEGRDLILIDDVLHTGRTVRAALNEIFAYGRPHRIRLAVLVERSGRELPMQADIIGARLPLAPHQFIKLTGPDPLRLVLTDRPHRCDPKA